MPDGGSSVGRISNKEGDETVKLAAGLRYMQIPSWRVMHLLSGMSVNVYLSEKGREILLGQSSYT